MWHQGDLGDTSRGSQYSTAPRRSWGHLLGHPLLRGAWGHLPGHPALYGTRGTLGDTSRGTRHSVAPRGPWDSSWNAGWHHSAPKGDRRGTHRARPMAPGTACHLRGRRGKALGIPSTPGDSNHCLAAQGAPRDTRCCVTSWGAPRDAGHHVAPQGPPRTADTYRGGCGAAGGRRRGAVAGRPGLRGHRSCGWQVRRGTGVTGGRGLIAAGRAVQEAGDELLVLAGAGGWQRRPRALLHGAAALEGPRHLGQHPRHLLELGDPLGLGGQQGLQPCGAERPLQPLRLPALQQPLQLRLPLWRDGLEGRRAPRSCEGAGVRALQHHDPLPRVGQYTGAPWPPPKPPTSQHAAAALPPKNP